MEFLSLDPGERLTATAPAIAEILTQADHEFIPPLSNRDSTTTKELAGGFDAAAPVGPPVAYLASVLAQHAILIGAGSGGFVSEHVGHQPGARVAVEIVIATHGHPRPQ